MHTTVEIIVYLSRIFKELESIDQLMLSYGASSRLTQLIKDVDKLKEVLQRELRGK
jgi:hypothetical protein